MDAVNTLLNTVVIVAVVGALVGALYYACIIPNAPAALVKIFRKVQKDWHCAKGAAPHSPKAGAPKAGAPKAGAPGGGAPKAGAPKAGAPKAGAPMAGAPMAGAPTAGAPKAGSPEAGSPKAGSPKAGAPGGGAPSSKYTLHKCVTINGDHPTSVPMQFTSSDDLTKCAESCEQDSVCQAATYNINMGECFHSSGFGADQWESWQNDDPFCMNNKPIPCYGVMVLPNRGAVVNIPPSTPDTPHPTHCT